MGNVKSVAKVKLFVAMLSPNLDIFEKVKPYLEKEFGKIDTESDIIPFAYTEFYEKEMGKGIMRKFYSFSQLIDPMDLSKIKIKTNSIEKDFFTVDGNRTINLDPGYIALSKLVLASVKERPHRICIGNGIFAEITLYFEKKSFRAWERTYPDYASSEYISYLNKVRSIYAENLKGNI